ncbi:MAG: glutathione ABC transporter substrate-binding protein [Acidimicrobiales bacterium]|nr:MAG: glutathione ABC transporter substrate-binding protein [Acidimicrobiales bacterium]
MRPVSPRRLIGLAVVTLSVISSCAGRQASSPEEAPELPSTAAAVTVTPQGEPTPGGTLVYGLEAESDGWNPARNRWALSGLMVAMAVYDPLAMLDERGEPHPYLAEAIQPNADYTVWTIRLREGVRFHDGTPLEARHVARALEEFRRSGLTGAALSPIAEVRTEDAMTVSVRMKHPWAAFPTILTGQVGVVPHPSVFDTEEGSARPVGTGPFRFEEWVPGKHWRGTRNENYWRRGLPLLDRVEFRPLSEPRTRANAVASGEVHVIHTSGDEDILRFTEAARRGEVQLVEDQGESEEVFVLLNTAAPPFDDVRVRRALSYATDRQAFIEALGNGILEPAYGPFSPSSPWYVDAGVPAYSPSRARQIVREVQQERGEIRFTMESPPGEGSVAAAQALQDMWEEVGFRVELKTAEQSQYILDALAGRYQAKLWRHFSSPDPDGDYHWWHSSGARPIGELSLNYARLRDAEIDDALDRGRRSADRSTRLRAYAEFQRRLGDLVPYVFIHRVRWVIVADPAVHDLTTGTLPDGARIMPLNAGWHPLTHAWIERRG